MPSRFAKALHWFFVIMLATNALYAAGQVFIVLAPEGHVGPLFGVANDVAPELLAARRLYAIEFWVSFGFLAVYTALTSQRHPRQSSPTRTS